MHVLAVAAGGVEVAVAVGVVIVAGAEDALEGAVDSGVVEDPLDRGYAGQDIVAGVALVGEYFFDMLVDVGVKFGGPVRRSPF